MMKIYKRNIWGINEGVYIYDELNKDYEHLGFNDNSEELLINYKKAYNLFESEFEI